MSLEHGYSTLQQVKSDLGLQASDGRDDEGLEAVIEAVSRMIDFECFHGESQFYAVTQTRYFMATSGDQLLVDDLLAVTSISTDGGDGTFATTWLATDYVLAPYNAQLASVPRPYWKIERAAGGSSSFPVGGLRSVRIVGSWGYCTDVNRPKQVESVCRRESVHHFTAARTPYGMTTGDGSVAVAPSLSLSKYSKLLLSPFRRVVMA